MVSGVRFLDFSVYVVNLDGNLIIIHDWTGKSLSDVKVRNSSDGSLVPMQDYTDSFGDVKEAARNRSIISHPLLPKPYPYGWGNETLAEEQPPSRKWLISTSSYQFFIQN